MRMSKSGTASLFCMEHRAAPSEVRPRLHMESGHAEITVLEAQLGPRARCALISVLCLFQPKILRGIITASLCQNLSCGMLRAAQELGRQKTLNHQLLMLMADAVTDDNSPL